MKKQEKQLLFILWNNICLKKTKLHPNRPNTTFVKRKPLM